jgi:putative endonuclease
MAEHNEKGNFGENLAAAYLIKNGYQIHERNFVFERAEIDIIAEKENTLVIVEVKTRASELFETATELVSSRQAKQIISATEGYIHLKKIDLETRFDVIAIILDERPPKIEHIKDAFYPTL